MRQIFADAFYWIAIANPRDPWYHRARATSQSPGPLRLVTTDEVLTDFLAFFASFGARMRETVSKMAHAVLNDPNILVLPQSRETFLAGLSLYESRPDKEYSLTDCISMQTTRSEGIREILTHDRHFSQEGFVLLLRE